MLVVGAAHSSNHSGEYVIGVMSAQSGYLAPYDGPSYAGFQFCVDEKNANGGLNGKMMIRTIVKDTRSDIAEGVKVVQEMIDEGAMFIVSSADADPTIAAGQITQADNIPTMTFAGTAPVLTQIGSHVFGSYPADNQQASVLAAYARSQGFSRVWLVKSPDSAYTLGGPEYFGSAFAANGGKVVGESVYTLNQPDFSAIVATIKAASPQPDVIVTWAWEPDFPAFIKALRGAGVNTQVMGGDVLDTPTVRGLGEVVAGVVHTSGGFPDAGSAYADFNRRFEAATGTRTRQQLLRQRLRHHQHDRASSSRRWFYRTRQSSAGDGQHRERRGHHVEFHLQRHRPHAAARRSRSAYFGWRR